MKIICDNCRTKYSIADEKVKGKVFKIRCKKCSNIIVVRGNQPADADAELAADGGAEQEADYKDAPVWHLVIDQQQVGPMTSAEVRDRFAQGEIDADCYIWREGFTDWLRLSQVEEFSDVAQATMVAPAAVAPAVEAPADLGGADQWSADANAAAPAQHEPAAWDAASSGAPDAGNGTPAWNAGAEAAPAAWDAGAGGETNRTDSDNLFGGSPASDEPAHDLFASNPANDPAPAAEGNLFGAPAASEGGDLFGAAAAGGQAGQEIFPGAGGQDEPQPASQLTGTRNENSVLFSLSNLQSLAMGGKPSPGAPVASAPGPGGGDGSGLIDIRSMAVATGPSRSSMAADDGLPDLGGFSAPIAAAPVLIPAASEERPGWLIPVIIAGAAVVVLGIVAVVLVIALKPDPQPVQVASAAGAGTQPGGGVAAAGGAATKAGGETKPAGATETGAASAGTGTGAAEKGADTPGETKPESKASGSRRSGRRSGRRGGTRKRPSGGDTGGSARGADNTPEAAPVKRRGGRKPDALDALLDDAVGGSKPKPKAARRAAPVRTAPESNLPETLGRSEIQAGMRGIKGKVQGCYDRFKVPGLANVQVKIGRNGQVNSARVKGMFSGTPTGACVQSAARSARFAKFKGAPITITYPFILR